MTTWRDLFLLRWMTGPDGRPAFYKLVLVSAGLWLNAVTAWCAMGGTLAACIWPLVSMAIVLVFGAHGLKGLAVWAASKAPPSVTAITATTVTADLAKMAEAIRARRDDAAGIEPTP